MPGKFGLEKIMNESFLRDRENIPSGIKIRRKEFSTEIVITHDGHDVMISNGLVGAGLELACLFILQQRYSSEPEKWLGSLWLDSSDAKFFMILGMLVLLGVFFLYFSLRCFRQRFVRTVITIDDNSGKIQMAHRHPSGKVNAVKFRPNEISTRQVIVGVVPRRMYVYALLVLGEKKKFLCYSLGEEKQQWLQGLFNSVRY